jgi:uncharacterized damage-inducible protein DinB
MQHLIYFQTLARYNHWMNEKLLSICAAMSDEERKQNRDAPFGSLHGTFNHLLVTDRLWLGRFKHQPFSVPSLDYELCADFDELKSERAKTDAEIFDWVDSLSEAALQGDLTVTSFSNPTQYTRPLWFFALHFFNHQTHHRGQITALIEQAGYDCSVTDLGAMPPEISGISRS